jgi:hypothetical protein
MTGWPIDGTEIIVKDEKEIFERVRPSVLREWLRSRVARCSLS